MRQQMMLNLIRLRLALWYVAVLAVILAAYGAVVYLGVAHLLRESLDRSLKVQADVVADSFDLDEGESDVLHMDEMPEEEAMSPWIRIIRRDGSLAYESPAFRALEWPFPLEKMQRGQPGWKAYFEEHPIPDQDPLRAIIYPIYARGELWGWVQVALPTQEIHQPLRTLLRTLLLTGPIALLLVGLGGYGLAGRTLRPVETMRSRAEKISHQNLSARLPVANPRDELGRLAQTFNRMMDRLEAAFISQQRFIADASHELKTPLAILRSHWEQEIENPEIPASVRRKLVADVEEIARLNKLVENLLILSRADEGKAQLIRERVPLSPVVREACEDARILASQKHQILELREGPEVILSADRNRLYQLLLNLLDNAVKYTPEGGRITVSWRLRHQWVELEVADNGIGIPSEDLPRVFDRFYRVDKARSRKLGGSGLGLSICKWIVEAHGGEISLTSQLGQGTTVHVRLPT